MLTIPVFKIIKKSFIMINNYVKNENISFTISLYVIICQ